MLVPLFNINRLLCEITQNMKLYKDEYHDYVITPKIKSGHILAFLASIIPFYKRNKRERNRKHYHNCNFFLLCQVHHM